MESKRCVFVTLLCVVVFFWKTRSCMEAKGVHFRSCQVAKWRRKVPGCSVGVLRECCRRCRRVWKHKKLIAKKHMSLTHDILSTKIKDDKLVYIDCLEVWWNYSNLTWPYWKRWFGLGEIEAQNKKCFIRSRDAASRNNTQKLTCSTFFMFFQFFSYQSCREMHLEFTPGNKPLAGASNGWVSRRVSPPGIKNDLRSEERVKS